MFLPVDILWIRGISNSPIVCVKLAAELRTLWVLTTVTALTLASIKVLQNSESKQKSRQVADITVSQEPCNISLKKQQVTDIS